MLVRWMEGGEVREATLPGNPDLKATEGFVVFIAEDGEKILLVVPAAALLSAGAQEEEN
jgi:hypothetical protein